MTAIRVLSALIFVAMVGYTGVTISNHGLNLLPVFFGDMAKMGWPGQFNFDFMFMLMLSGLWTMWRNHFSGKGLLLGTLAFFGGALFLSAYLFILAGKAKNVLEILVGPERASS